MPRVAILKAKSGTYQDKKTGQTKTSYTIVGSVIEGSNGRSYKLDSVPVGFDGWLFEAELPERRDGAGPRPSVPQPVDDIGDDVPF
jgi:hypothetical protein